MLIFPTLTGTIGDLDMKTENADHCGVNIKRVPSTCYVYKCTVYSFHIQYCTSPT